MKRNQLRSTIIVLFSICSALLWQGCPTPVKFNGLSFKVKSVKNGNTIVLDNLLTVKLLGIQDTPSSKDYLENNVKGKTIVLKADSKNQDEYSNPSKETVYAHVSVKEDKGKRLELNGYMLLSGFAKLKTSPNHDSAKVYKQYTEWEASTPLTDEQLCLKMTPATFWISVGKEGHGTGFFISDDGLALTNNHVMEYINNPDYYTVYLSDAQGHISQSNSRRVARILYTDPQNDFTIFRVMLDPNETATSLSISRKAPERGQHVGVMGNPRGLTSTFSTGIVSAIRESDNDIQFNAPIAPGNSGGPLCNESGNVIGVVKSTLADPETGKSSKEDLNFAVDIRYVRNVLDQIQDIKHYNGK